MSQRTEHGMADTVEGERVATGALRDRRLSRRSWTLIISLILVVALGLIGSFVTVPYVAIGPGPTYDTLGSVSGTKVVTIDGKKTYPPTGQLRMVTVSLTDDVTLFGAIGMWLSGRQALAPREAFFPSGKSVQQVEHKNLQQMRHSQSVAEVAALRYLGYPIAVLADKIVSGSPADGKIKPGDQLLKINGKKVKTSSDPYRALMHTRPGQTVPVTVRTPGQQPRMLRITLGKHQHRTQGFLGVTPVPHAEVPFDIQITLPDVGGPSAGMMFAVAVIDKLTPGSLSGGKHVAGTGEIAPNGDVGPIGGIPFKMIAARGDGARVFLVPAQNCSEAAARVPDGLRLVKVSTLRDAVHELRALKAGKPVQGCG